MRYLPYLDSLYIQGTAVEYISSVFLACLNVSYTKTHFINTYEMKSV